LFTIIVRCVDHAKVEQEASFFLAMRYSRCVVEISFLRLAVQSTYLIQNFSTFVEIIALRSVTFCYSCISLMYLHGYRQGSSCRTVVHDIETVVIDWTHQIREVLKKDSAQPLLEGLNPTPYVEIEFWNAKSQNLSCIFNQVSLRSLLVTV